MLFLFHLISEGYLPVLFISATLSEEKLLRSGFASKCCEFVIESHQLIGLGHQKVFSAAGKKSLAERKSCFGRLVDFLQFTNESYCYGRKTLGKS